MSGCPLFNETTLIYATGAGITAAAGTRHALQSILQKTILKNTPSYYQTLMACTVIPYRYLPVSYVPEGVPISFKSKNYDLWKNCRKISPMGNSPETRCRQNRPYTNYILTNFHRQNNRSERHGSALVYKQSFRVGISQKLKLLDRSCSEAAR